MPLTPGAWAEEEPDDEGWGWGKEGIFGEDRSALCPGGPSPSPTQQNATQMNWIPMLKITHPRSQGFSFVVGFTYIEMQMNRER